MSTEVEGRFVLTWNRLAHVNQRRYSTASRDEAIEGQEKGGQGWSIYLRRRMGSRAQGDRIKIGEPEGHLS